MTFPRVTEQVRPLSYEARQLIDSIQPRPTVARLLADVAAGLRVLVTRDGLRISEELIQERTNNIVAGLLGNYEITGTGE